MKKWIFFAVFCLFAQPVLAEPETDRLNDALVYIEKRCFVKITFANGGFINIRFGTRYNSGRGFFIANESGLHLVVTAAHVVHCSSHSNPHALFESNIKPDEIEKIEIIPKIKIFYKNDVYFAEIIGSDYFPYDSNSQDQATLKVLAPLELKHHSLPVMLNDGLSYSANEPGKSEFLLSGFVIVGNYTYSRPTRGNITEIEGDVLKIDIRVFPGESGSPLVRLHNGRLHAIGVLTRVLESGGVVYNISYASAFNKDYLENLGKLLQSTESKAVSK